MRRVLTCIMPQKYDMVVCIQRSAQKTIRQLRAMLVIGVLEVHADFYLGLGGAVMVVLQEGSGN
jgi:hypothetical protein